jgi:hypothetical protein
MDTKPLTYAELAEALGITPASAKRLAIRRGWPKQLGNDGKARVMVPLERLERPVPDDDTSEATDDAPSVTTGDDTSGDTRDARALIAFLEARVTELGDEVKELRPKAARADVLEAQLEAERRRAEELKTDRDRLLSVVTDRSREGLFTRLRRAFG